MKIQLRVHSQIKTNINGTLKQIHAMRERIIISINDIRITPQTGIKNSGEYVAIGNVGRIDPSKDITIKAIGSPAVLKESITFGTTSKYQLLKLYNVDVKEVKDEEGIILEKSTQSLKSDYVKKIE